MVEAQHFLHIRDVLYGWAAVKTDVSLLLLDMKGSSVICGSAGKLASLVVLLAYIVVIFFVLFFFKSRYTMVIWQTV